MEHSAIFHDTNKKYCCALEKGLFAIRLKTKKDDLRNVTLHYVDKYIPVEFHDTSAKIPMKKIASDRWCDYYEAQIQIDMVCLRYHFELEDQSGQVFYYGNHEFFEEKITNKDNMYDCPQTLREEEMFSTPEWAKNKIIYQIFPSRFASSKKISDSIWYQTPMTAGANLEGDLRGIIEHLDHLKELGVDVIYMTPIFESPSRHKYNTVDYYKIDSSFGTKEDLKELVEKAHELGMRVILDAVFNHTDIEFFAFKDIREKQQDSRYIDWYYIQDFPLKSKWGTKPNYKCFSYYGGMPKLNLQNPEVADYCIKVALYWLEECKIDGWRLDVADEISHHFWRKFRGEIKKSYPHALIIGEIWHHAEDFLDGDEWDTVMNYPFYFAINDLIAEEKITVSNFLGQMGYLEGNLHKNICPILWNLIDSHDTARFMNKCGENVDKFKLGTALQLLWTGMPFIYYGDEYGMTGGPDPDCRRGMVWDEQYQNPEIYQWYRRLIQVRKEFPVLTEGETKVLYCDDSRGIFALEKTLDGQTLILLVHAKDGQETIDFLPEQSMYNLLKETEFLSILQGFEVAVLQKM